MFCELIFRLMEVVVGTRQSAPTTQLGELYKDRNVVTREGGIFRMPSLAVLCVLFCREASLRRSSLRMAWSPSDVGFKTENKQSWFSLLLPPAALWIAGEEVEDIVAEKASESGGEVKQSATNPYEQLQKLSRRRWAWCIIFHFRGGCRMWSVVADILARICML